MKLSQEDADLFFRLTIPLLLYVNRRLGLLPKVDTEKAFADTTLDEKARLRDALYDDLDLIDAFVAENPNGFAADELAEIRSWKRVVRGEFYIVRFLKRYAVFLSAGSPARAYGVVGLHDDLDELTWKYDLPLHVQTALLPFKGRIVYDGLMSITQVLFGPNIRAELNETYQGIRENRGIIERLDQPEGSAAPPRRARKVTPELLSRLDALLQEAERLPAGGTPLQGRAIRVLRAAARLAQMTAAAPESTEDLPAQIRQVELALRQLETALYRKQRWG
jgi:hypothetical protein